MDNGYPQKGLFASELYLLFSHLLLPFAFFTLLSFFATGKFLRTAETDACMTKILGYSVPTLLLSLLLLSAFWFLLRYGARPSWVKSVALPVSAIVCTGGGLFYALYRVCTPYLSHISQQTLLQSYGVLFVTLLVLTGEILHFTLQPPMEPQPTEGGISPKLHYNLRHLRILTVLACFFLFLPHGFAAIQSAQLVQDTGIPFTMYAGVTLSLFSLGGFFAFALSKRIEAAMGSVSGLRLGLALAALSLLGNAFCKIPPLFLLTKLTHGLGYGIFFTQMQRMVNSTEQSNVKTQYSRTLVLGQGIGLFSGFVVGAVLADLVQMSILCGLAAVGLLLCQITLASRLKILSVIHWDSPKNRLRLYSGVWLQPKIQAVWLCILLPSGISFSLLLLTMLPVFAGKSWYGTQMALAFLLYALGSRILSPYVFQKIRHLVQEKYLILIPFLLVSALAWLYAYRPATWLLAALLVMLGFLGGLCPPIAQRLVGRIATKNNIPMHMAISATDYVLYIPSVVGPLLIGVLLTLSLEAMIGVGGICFASCSVLYLISCMESKANKRRHRKFQETPQETPVTTDQVFNNCRSIAKIHHPKTI